MEVESMSAGRHAALEVLTAAQEGISVKSLIEFRGLSEVSSASQAVATSAVCMVAGIDEAVEADAEGLPPRTWEAARAVLAKPGHFINSLRRFPYAVDGGRLPAVNVTCARQCMEGTLQEEINAEPLVAQQLFRWVVAAWEYCEHVPDAFGGGADPGFSRTDFAGIYGTQAAGFGAQAVDPATGLPVAAAVGLVGTGAGPTPALAPAHATAPAGVMGLGAAQAAPGPAAARRGPGPAGPQSPERSKRGSMGSTGRSSMGRSSMGSSSPASSSTYTATRRAARSPGTAAAAAAGALHRQQERLARAGAAPASARVSARAQDTSMVSSTSSRRSPGATGGYPRSARSGAGGIQDQRRQLEALMKETRELRAQEAHMKWSMKREEDKQKKVEKKHDEQETLAWRQEHKAETVQLEVLIKKEQKTIDLQESRAFQEHKRSVKADKKEVELQQVREDYAETKENSEYAIETKKLEMAEWPKPIIEENLEKYRLMAEYNLEEQRREDEEKKEARAAKEQAEMDLVLMKARQEKELALQHLEYVRGQQQAAVPAGLHLAARPK